MEEKKEKHYYPIFNRKGKASYYLDGDKVHIYSWDGKPVAFIEKGCLFSFKKKHLGWHDEGWVRALDGKCVGFTEPGKGGPSAPKARHPADPPADKKEVPETPEIKDFPGRAPRRPLWSDLSEDAFLKGPKEKKPPKKAPPKKIPTPKKPAAKKTAAKKGKPIKAAKKKAAAKKSGKKK